MSMNPDGVVWLGHLFSPRDFRSNPHIIVKKRLAFEWSESPYIISAGSSFFLPADGFIRVSGPYCALVSWPCPRCFDLVLQSDSTVTVIVAWTNKVDVV